MDMVLVDWTRMGRSYCLAGAVVERGQVRIVRPLLTRNRGASVRNVGWSAFLVDGHGRWEIFELIEAAPAVPEPPHLEDVWVRALRSRRQLAAPELRRAILAATRPPPGEPLFGAPLGTTHTATYLPPATGRRSLLTVVVPGDQIRFEAYRRTGSAEANWRVTLPLPEVGLRTLPVTDHHLLLRAEDGTANLDERLERLAQAVRRMGDQVAVRLGLSRPFPGHAPAGEPECWLMANGFFSLADPQS